MEERTVETKVLEIGGKTINLDQDTPLPILTHIINTHNEGDDVRQTIISFRNAYSGPYHCIVIADGTTDGSCDNLDPLISAGDTCPRCRETGLTNGGCPLCLWLNKWNPVTDKLQVIHNAERVGCGKAKEQAQLLADPDSVIVHSDGHCRMLIGDLDNLVRLAAQNEIVVSPGVAPLHCPSDEQPRIGKEWGERQTRWKKNHTTWGGQILIDAMGAKVDACAQPHNKYALREATFWAIFLVSAKTLRQRLGGWNKLPGRWGSQEIGLALRTWFADVPIITARDIISGHRYRADQRKDKKPYAPYFIRTSERRANHRYIHQVVFSPRTCQKIWKPNWNELCPSKGGYEMLVGSDLNVQGKYFRTFCKRRTDEDFQNKFCPNGWPMNLIPLKDITAVVLCYRRPVNQQKCIDALVREKLKVWAWCNEGATQPHGCERVFTDTANASTWGRYCIAPLIPTPWILFCDDDAELTGAGIRALRAGGALGIDNCGLIGARFTPPTFDDYHKRAYYKSHKIREAVPVDMLWPKGQLIFRDTAVEIFGARNDLWQRMRERVGTTSGDDLIATIAQALINKQREPFGRFPHVVPSSDKGYAEHQSEGKEFSLTKQPGRMSKKRRTMKVWRDEFGWRSVAECIASGNFWQPDEVPEVIPVHEEKPSAN